MSACGAPGEKCCPGDSHKSPSCSSPVNGLQYYCSSVHSKCMECGTGGLSPCPNSPGLSSCNPGATLQRKDVSQGYYDTFCNESCGHLGQPCCDKYDDKLFPDNVPGECFEGQGTCQGRASEEYYEWAPPVTGYCFK